MVVSAYQSFQEKSLKHRRYIFSSDIKTWKLDNWVKIASDLKRNFNLWIKEQRINKVWELKLNCLKFYSVFWNGSSLFITYLEENFQIHTAHLSINPCPTRNPMFSSLVIQRPFSYLKTVLNKFRMLECKYLYFFHWNIVRKSELQVIVEFS